MASDTSAVLPIDAAERKAAPVFSGLIAYFPKTAIAVARLSLAGNIQHYGPGKPLHWNREVSADHQDCMIRHTMQSGSYDTDGILHDVKAAWRALAQAEVTIDRLEADRARALPPSPLDVDDDEPGSLKHGEAYREHGA